MISAVQVTENTLIQSVTINNYYSVNPGRAIDFEYEAMLNEVAPTTD